MKIIQITTFFHPVTGGVEQQVLEMSKHLKKIGHDVTVFTTDSGRITERITSNESVVDGIRVKRFKTIFSLSTMYKIAPNMFFELLRADYDILHVHGFRKFEVYMALLAAKIKKKKIVVTTHNPFTTNTRSKNLDFFVNLHDKTFGRWFSKYINKVIPLLPSEIEILISNFNIQKSNIQVIPNGIEDSFYETLEFNKEKFLDELLSKSIKNPLPEDNRGRKKSWNGIVLSACRLNKVKGLQNLKLAADKLKNTLFIFIGGDDGYKDQLMQLYRNNKNVVITGYYIPHEDVQKAFNLADIFVLPSLHEPFGLTPLEAVASGTPLIATNNGGTKEIFNNKYVKFIDPNNQELWHQEIKNLLENPKLRDTNVLKSRQDIEKYKWSNVIQRIDELYKSLLTE